MGYFSQIRHLSWTHQAQPAATRLFVVHQREGHEQWPRCEGWFAAGKISWFLFGFCMEWEVWKNEIFVNFMFLHVFTSTRRKKHQRNCRMILWWMALFQDIPGWWNNIYSDWRHVIKWFLWESSDMKRFSQKHKGIGFGSIWVLH